MLIYCLLIGGNLDNIFGLKSSSKKYSFNSDIDVLYKNSFVDNFGSIPITIKYYSSVNGLLAL